MEYTVGAKMNIIFSSPLAMFNELPFSSLKGIFFFLNIKKQEKWASVICHPLGCAEQRIPYC